MSTLIIKAPGTLSSPLAGTPQLPDLARGLLFDFDARSLNLAEGAGVTSLSSKGGSWGTSLAILNASGDRVPKFAVNGVSAGNAAIKFTATPATYLRTANVTPIVPSVNTPLTVSVLAKFNVSADGTAYMNLFSGRNGEPGAYVYARRNPNGQVSIGGGGTDQLLSSGIAPVGTWCVITCVFDGARSKVVIDKVTTTGSTLAAYWDGLVLGANATTGNNLNGDVAAFRGYIRALSDSEIQLVRQEFLTSRGLAA